MSLISYSNGEEVLICKKKHEDAFLGDYFGEGGSREFTDYARLEHEDDIVVIRSNLEAL